MFGIQAKTSPMGNILKRLILWALESAEALTTSKALATATDTLEQAATSSEVTAEEPTEAHHSAVAAVSCGRGSNES